MTEMALKEEKKFTIQDVQEEANKLRQHILERINAELYEDILASPDTLEAKLLIAINEIKSWADSSIADEKTDHFLLRRKEILNELTAKICSITTLAEEFFKLRINDDDPWIRKKRLLILKDYTKLCENDKYALPMVIYAHYLDREKIKKQKGEE